MGYALAAVVIVVASFLLGSIPCGVLVGRIGYGGDPREGGSGAIGMTNMNRLFGFKAAAITFVGDVAKGAVAVAVARLVLSHVQMDAAWMSDLGLILSVAAVIFGHVFCPWLGFKGGKGISTGLGSILVAFPLVAVTILGVFLVFALATRTISAGSICAAIAFPVFSYVYYPTSPAIIVTALAVGVAVVVAHRGNIVRLLRREEPKFSFNRSAERKEGEEDD